MADNPSFRIATVGCSVDKVLPLPSVTHPIGTVPNVYALFFVLSDLIANIRHSHTLNLQTATSSKETPKWHRGKKLNARNETPFWHQTQPSKF
jgi:hypothetical protein